MRNDDDPRSVTAALMRGIGRNFTIFVMAMTLYHTADFFPLFFGPVWAPWVRNFGLLLTAVNCLDIVMRIWQPYLDNKQLGNIAEKDPRAAAIMYGSRMIFAAIVFMTLAISAKAGSLNQMPPGAVKYSPLLVSEMGRYWPTQKLLSLNGAQIEQETCVRLTSPECWTSRAQLNVTSKNGVEKGRGFGQLTAVWRANGKKRFDNIDLMHLKYPKELGNYGWDNWSDPELSMRAYVLFMRDTCKSVPREVTSSVDRFKMCISGYNGGMSGLNDDILRCRATPGCNPTVWDNNVALTSAKSKTRVPGYGQPAYEINRSYIRNVTVDRRARYLSLDQLV